MPLNKSVVSPVLIGRADDLAVIHRLMENAAEGRGQIALVAGEAGIGKSRLVSEAIQHARDLSFKIMEGSSFETDRALPYAPLLDLLRTFCTEHQGNNLSVYFGSTASELVKILPELGGAIQDIAPSAPLEPEQEKHRLFQAMAQFLIKQSSEDRLFVVIEDLHWCDDTTLDFLLHFTRHIQSHPILILLTYRNDEIHPALGHFLAELDRRRLPSELILPRLSPASVDSMLRAIFNLERPVRAEFMDVLYSLTDGNPFFIEEILKSLITAGEIFYSDGIWDRKPVEQLNIPRSISDAVRRRVGQLSEAARETLSLAAVVGQRFDFSLLRILTGQRENDLLPLIKELVAVQLIVEESSERFVFRHALTREAIYSQLLARERAALHGKIGKAMEQLASKPSDQQVASLAYHFHQAGDWRKAMEYSQRAGEKAQALHAPRAAVEHFTRAMDSAHHLSISPAAQSYRARGAAFEKLGEFERARADYENALQSARVSGDRLQEWHSLLDLGLLWAGRDYARTGTYYQQAYELARTLNDPALLAHALNRLGNWNVNIERPDEGLEHHMEALKVFQQLNDPKGLAETFDLLGMANYIHGNLVQSEYYYKQAVELFREMNLQEGLASTPVSMLLNNGYLQSGMAVLAKTDRAAALGACEEALRITREIGWRAGEAYALIILGNYHGLRGNYAKAFDLLGLSLTIAEEIEHSQWTVYARYCLGMLYADVLDLSRGQEYLQSALALAREIGSPWWLTNIAGTLASTHVLEKQYERAASELDQALKISVNTFLSEAGEIQALTLGQRRCWCACAELALARGQPDSALHIIDQLINSSANMESGGVISRLWLLRGEALTALGKSMEAEQMLLAAQRDADREGEKPLLWRIYAGLGKSHQNQLRREEASDAFGKAQKIIEELSAQIPEPGLGESFSKRAPAFLPRPQSLTARQTAKREFGGLTAREREVAALVAQGRSNREAGDALVVSERTIETHVENILSKLGFSSRAQIAAWAVEKGLLKEKGS